MTIIEKIERYASEAVFALVLSSDDGKDNCLYLSAAMNEFNS